MSNVLPESILSCQFQEWYPKLRKHSLPSRIIKLPNEFVQFLVEDGIDLPQHLLRIKYDDIEIVDPDDEAAASEADKEHKSEDITIKTNTNDEFFPDLIIEIEKAMTQLGGNVFPKLNWHSPQDAAWIATTKSLHCTNVGDILLLLKSSTKIANDILNPFEHCIKTNNNKEEEVEEHIVSEYVLVLKKWCHLKPSQEFRCFVRDNELVGISQKDACGYSHLQDPMNQEKIENAIYGLYEDHISSVFNKQCNYVFDCYIDIHDKVWIMDMDPWLSPLTDTYLFSWDELKTIDGKNDTIIRVIDEDNHLNPVTYAPGIVNRMPDENVDISDAKAIEGMIAVMKLQNLQDQEAAGLI